MVRRTAAAIIQVSLYNGLAAAYSVAVGPAGRRVYVTGYARGAAATSCRDYATIAYKAATGARLWVSLGGRLEEAIVLYTGVKSYTHDGWSRSGRSSGYGADEGTTARLPPSGPRGTQLDLAEQIKDHRAG